jgi:hypothetical protein
MKALKVQPPPKESKIPALEPFVQFSEKLYKCHTDFLPLLVYIRPHLNG